MIQAMFLTVILLLRIGWPIGLVTDLDGLPLPSFLVSILILVGLSTSYNRLYLLNSIIIFNVL